MNFEPLPPQAIEQTPKEKIDAALETIMGDPNRIMAPERDARGELPLPVPGVDGSPLATFQTLSDPAHPDSSIVVIDIPNARMRGAPGESFNYYSATGQVVYSPAPGGERLQGQAAQDHLALIAEGLADRWRTMYDEVA